MASLWFCLGGILILSLWALERWNSSRGTKLSILGWGGLLLTLLAFLFTLAWFVSSLIEGEAQAAGMGLLVFGGATLVLFAATLRIVRRSGS